MEWIKCSERLPEEGEYVLTYDGNLNLDNKPFYEIAAYRTFNNGSFFISGPYSLQNIKFWMPLPSPPNFTKD
jgi:hypothetical protein